MLDRRNEDLQRQIREKDNQIREKDNQILKLKDIKPVTVEHKNKFVRFFDTDNAFNIWRGALICSFIGLIVSVCFIVISVH